MEWLGIGVHGSREAAPDIEAVEFSQAILKVLHDAEIRSKATAMRDICMDTEGRVLAHDKIVEFCS